MSLGMQVKRKGAGIALAVFVLVLGVAGPASAHDSAARLYYGGYWRGHGGVTASHNYVFVCDDRSDGYGIYIKYSWQTDNRENGRFGVGNAPACKQIYTSPEIRSYVVCMNVPYDIDPCTPRTYVPQ